MSNWGTDQYNATVVKVAGNAYTVALSPLPATLTNGMQVRFRATQAATGPMTIIMQGLYVKTFDAVPVVRPDGTATASGDIANGQLVSVLYDTATNTFVLHSFPQQPYTAPTRFTSPKRAFPGVSSALTEPHGLAAVPFYVRVVAVNIITNRSYAVNDEVGIETLTANTANGAAYFSVVVDTTNVVVSQDSDASCFIIPKGGGGKVTITQADWNLKVYAQL